MIWEIRSARLEDSETLLPLWRAALDLHVELAPEFFRAPTAMVARAELARAVETTDRYRCLLVAVNEPDRIGGFITAAVFDTPKRPTMAPRRRAHVDQLFVVENRRRSGCGRALVDAAAKWARNLGAHALLLTAWAGNQEGERFYRTLGFRTVSQEMGLQISPKA